MAYCLLVLNRKIFKQTLLRLKVMASMWRPKKIWNIFQNLMGSWDASRTCAFILQQYFWPSVPVETTSFVKWCTGCQKYKPLSCYQCTISTSLKTQLQIFSTIFRGALTHWLEERKNNFSCHRTSQRELVTWSEKHGISDVMSGFIQE